MSGFQRFVTYINLYEENNKIRSVGFARVERQGEQCKIEIHMRGTGYTGISCPVHLFVRRENTMAGISIGKLQLTNGTGDGRFLLEGSSVGGSGHDLSEIGGFLIFVNERVMFASQWDDKEILRERFVAEEEWRAAEQREAERKEEEQREAERKAEEKREAEKQEEEQKKAEEVAQQQRSRFPRQQNSRPMQRNTSQTGRNSQFSVQARGQSAAQPNQLNSQPNAQMTRQVQPNQQSEKLNQQLARLEQANQQSVQSEQLLRKPIESVQPETCTKESKSAGQNLDQQPKQPNTETVEYKASSAKPAQQPEQPGAQPVEFEQLKWQPTRSTQPVQSERLTPQPVQPIQQNQPNQQPAWTNPEPVNTQPIQQLVRQIQPTQSPSRVQQKEQQPSHLDLQKKQQSTQLEFQIPEQNPQPADPIVHAAEAAAQLTAQPQQDSWAVKWQFILENYPVLTPFEGEDDIRCVRLELKDLRILPKRHWYLGNNSFLLHGFFNYRYVILGAMGQGTDQRWFLGVPGVYQSQEKVMAAIFGFAEYKSEKIAEQKTNQFGYWYRFLE